MKRLSFFLAAGLLLGLTSAAAQQPWVVRQQWVQAHEEFLASDVMAGRGSATRDEEIAATYVASEFLAYGLTTAPGMTGYLQSARVFAPVLDGKARLAALKGDLNEGTDFDLITSSGHSVSGPMVRLKVSDVATAKFAKGSVVLLTGVDTMMAAQRVIRPLGRAGAALVLLPGTGEVANLMAAVGGKTRTPVRLADAEAAAGVSVAVLHANVMTDVAMVKDGEQVELTVHEVPQTAARKTFNALGYLPGTDAKAGTLLLTAHLDHLGIGKPVNGDSIFNGANDDAAGTTAVLELAHALAAGPKLKRSVLFVCYGSEEIGELGSTYFGEHPPVPLTDLVANLEFEMIGAQDPKMPKGVLLLTGWERSNLGPTLKAHGALLGPDPYPEQHFFERSDNYALALKGVVAHTAAGWGTVPTYHQPNDDLAHLDVPFMTTAIQSLVEPVRWLASSDFRPAWNPDGQPKRR